MFRNDHARFYPFTLLMLVGLGLGAVVGSIWLAEFPKLVLEELGFSANDLGAGMPARLVTSAFVTHGGWVAVRALLFTAVFVGWAERERGTVVAATTFWGSHLVVLIALALGLVGLSRLGIAPQLAAARDLGPSAGYMACVGLLAGRRRRRRAAFGVVVLLLLVALFWVDPPPPRSVQTDRLADLAHLGSFLLGAAIARALDRREQ